MDQNNYEIQSITEAGIEDGSSIMFSEFNRNGQRNFVSHLEKIKFTNKLNFLKYNNS